MSSGARFASPPEAGQLALLVEAKGASIFVSLYMRLRNTIHLACPIVCPPESAVISLALKPLAENMEIRVERLEAGDGIWELAALWLAVLASLRPSCTVHVGPPSCVRNHLRILVNRVIKNEKQDITSDLDRLN